MAGMPHAMSDEWFRSPLWREKDRELFEAKLARAHKHNRAQYMRIKALSLAESGDRAARAAAGDLFERIFSEYPDDRLQVTMAHADKARWHRQGGEHDQAVRHYRRAVALEDAHGSIDSGVDLSARRQPLHLADRSAVCVDEADVGVPGEDGPVVVQRLERCPCARHAALPLAGPGS
jgi:hypothetical protein